MDWGLMEAKWRKRWEERRHFEANPDDRPKKFITVAYPYPNSPQHIGHGRTYTIADIHARYYRMRGFNVLFPMAFHYTGTPILGMSKRVESKDPEIMDGLRNIYHVADDVIRTFVEPVKIADYFHAEIKAGMIEMGYSIDWRREFTTIDPAYQKFIEWQVSTLREKNLIIQGSHPVGWCPKDQNPVSQHDTLGDVEPDFTEYILVKFKMGDFVIPAATLRPETVFGVTNLWVNPEVTYEKISVDGEKWIVSGQCAYKLEFLDKKITHDGTISGRELAGKTASVPGRGTKVPILAAGFVEAQTGTGLVMSVPAHAPFDWQALEDLKKTGDAAALQIEPISIIATDGYGDCPAMEVCRGLKIKDQDDPRLKEATSEVYGKEFYGGILGENTAEFAGRKVSESREPIREWLAARGCADVLLELTESVRCRCGARCLVKILANQWFLDYGNKQWKAQAARCFDGMSIIPQEIRKEFVAVLDWLHERACARQHGLGTRLPWDGDWMVESLSDSVIYMAYYTLARFVNDGTIRAESLSGEFFDFVLLGSGDAQDASEKTGISADVLREIRGEFSYFYPVDSRHSGRDLIPNHLTFFILNHVAIFPERDWPQEIVVNGSVLMDGKKMSKSMGNIIPLRQAIKEHGADPIRLAIIISSELLQDADFNLESVAGIKGKLEALHEQCSRIAPQEPEMLAAEDRWINSKLQEMIADVTASIEGVRLREGLHYILFAFEASLHWYLRRARAKGRKDTDAMLYRINRVRTAMLSPFAPHIAEELWEAMGQTGMVSQSEWPKVAHDGIDPAAIQAENLLAVLMDDIAKIVKVTKMAPKRAIIYTADGLKSESYRTILGHVMASRTDMGVIMRDLIASPDTAQIKSNPDFVQRAIRDILSETVAIKKARMQAKIDEKAVILGELACLARADLGVEVEVYSESDPGIYDPQGKARHARPFRPAIYME